MHAVLRESHGCMNPRIFKRAVRMSSIAPHSAWMVGPPEQAIKIERGLNIRGNVSAIAKKG